MSKTLIEPSPSLLVDALQNLSEAGDLLSGRYHFDWPKEVRQGVMALRFRSISNQTRSYLPMIAVVGGASSGKSTLYNNLLEGHLASRIHIRSHTTLGPIMAVHERHRARVEHWLYQDRTLFPGLVSREASLDDDTAGVPDGLTVIYHWIDRWTDVLLLDTPDFTSDAARREGDLSLALLPWFDKLIVVLDHERWFDRQSIGLLRQRTEGYGQARMAVFNRTREGDLAETDREKLAGQAARLDAAQWTVIDYRLGRGFRRLPASVVDTVAEFAESPSEDRSPGLARRLAKSANHVLNANQQRSRALTKLHSTLDRTVAQQVPGTWECMTSIMTTAERERLNLVSRVLRLNDTRQWLDRQRMRLEALMERVPVVGGLLISPRSSQNSNDLVTAKPRGELGIEHFHTVCRRQFDVLRAVASGSDLRLELEPWTTFPSVSSLTVPALLQHRAEEVVEELASAIEAWNRKVDSECRGVSPHLVGAMGATVLGVAVVLIAVQGPLSVLTVPAASAAIGAAMGKLAVAAGAGAVVGKHAGRFAAVVQEQLLGSPEFQTVKDATECYRLVLAEHADGIAESFRIEARSLILPAGHPLVRSLENLRAFSEEDR